MRESKKMYNIQFTEAAVKHITKMLDQQQGRGIRLSVKQTGCAGFSYVPSIVSHANAEDEYFMWQEKLPVYLDSAAVQYLHNVLIDYGSTDQSMLSGKRLIFINPNEKSRCGCGESFHV